MNRDEIIRMAREAQMPYYYRTGEVTNLEQLERFAALVAAAERESLLEALTAICVKCRSNEWGPDTPRKEILNWMHDHASAAIRARGDKT